MVKVFQFPYTKRLRTGEMKLDTGNDPKDYTEEELAQLSKSTLINEVIPIYQEQIRQLRQENKLLRKKVATLEERLEKLEDKIGDDNEKDVPDFKPSTDPPDEDSQIPAERRATGVQAGRPHPPNKWTRRRPWT